MDDDEILALYKWEPTGAPCFRCAQGDLDETTVVTEVHTPLGDHVEFRACAGCILALEAERRRFAEKVGVKYEPGTLRP